MAMRQTPVREVHSAKVYAGEPPLVSGAGMDKIRGPRLYGRCEVVLPASLRLRGRHKVPRSGRRVGGQAPLPDHFASP
jgi:hypothetical protein